MSTSIWIPFSYTSAYPLGTTYSTRDAWVKELQEQERKGHLGSNAERERWTLFSRVDLGLGGMSYHSISISMSVLEFFVLNRMEAVCPENRIYTTPEFLARKFAFDDARSMFEQLRLATSLQDIVLNSEVVICRDDLMAAVGQSLAQQQNVDPGLAEKRLPRLVDHRDLSVVLKAINDKIEHIRSWAEQSPGGHEARVTLGLQRVREKVIEEMARRAKAPGDMQEAKWLNWDPGCD